MNKFLIILAVIILFGGGWYFLNDQNKTGTLDAPGSMREIRNKKAADGEDSMAMTGEKGTLAEELMKDDSSIVAFLTDVTGGNSTGKGYILRKDGMLYHYVLAELPKPEGNNKYEGWLVKKEPGLTFFPTGVMKVVEEGVYEVSFTSEDESVGYDFVVITEETVVDETPEKHIIEGSAK